MKIFVFGLALFPILAMEIRSAEKSRPGFEDEVSYTNDIQPIVKNFCTTCHAGDDPEGELDLTTYESVREQAEKGDLLHRINDAKDPMPEDGLMPGYLRRVFDIWSRTGYIKQGKEKAAPSRVEYQEFKPPVIKPVTLEEGAFELLESLNGHWVGPMTLMGTKYDWMAFDYRPIAPSHVHGIFEGGTIGNLFTSFFVTEYKGTKTIMARNGGILNGIYRTSYFVLDKVQSGWGKKSYRLVDAHGGKDIMYMELSFSRDSMRFKAYTSRMGMTEPKLHMDFQAKRKRPELAAAAAKAVGFPKKVIDFPMPKVMPKPTWVDQYPHTSASYLSEGKGKSLIELASLSKDPRRIDQMPHLSQLTVDIERTAATRGKKVLLFLSQKALTDEQGKFFSKWGYVRVDLLDTLLLYPELSTKTDQFTFTYLHPGEYYVSAIADMNGDGYPSKGDITHPAMKVTVTPESHQKISVGKLSVQN